MFMAMGGPEQEETNQTLLSRRSDVGDCCECRIPELSSVFTAVFKCCRTLVLACMSALALFLDDHSLAQENYLPSRYHFVSWWSLPHRIKDYGSKPTRVSLRSATNKYSDRLWAIGHLPMRSAQTCPPCPSCLSIILSTMLSWMCTSCTLDRTPDVLRANVRCPHCPRDHNLHRPSQV